MISSLLSLYIGAALYSPDLASSNIHVIPWSENVNIEEMSNFAKKKPENIAPLIDAKAAIAVDMKNGMILYEKNIHEKMSIASLTKLMTTILIIEENDPAEIVTITNYASKTEGSKIWLTAGEKITIENLLYAALINSANDAATALAEFNSGGKIKDFVIKMNKKAEALNLYSTHFVNPTGLDDLNFLEEQPEKTEDDIAAKDSSLQKPDILDTNSNYSTAYDLALLGKYAWGKSIIRRAVSKKELEISSTNEKITHKLKTTNDLLNSYLKVLGLKTGTTDGAGECLIAIIQNDNGNDIMTVVLNSPSRYKETKILTDWVFRSYQW